MPDSRAANKQECELLAEALDLEMFEYITTRPGSESMTKSQTTEVRELVLRNKFIFNTEAIPKGYNILIYDDAMKSGMTLDKVCEPFGDEREVVAVVKTLYPLRELPAPSTKRL